MRYVVLVLLVCGCTHVSVQGTTGGGTTVTSTGVSVGYAASGSAAVWALIGIGLIAAHQHASGAARERGPDAPPPLAPNRSVNEVDCTKPIENWSANLKCR